jgi:hypothetical protein
LLNAGYPARRRLLEQAGYPLHRASASSYPCDTVDTLRPASKSERQRLHSLLTLPKSEPASVATCTATRSLHTLQAVTHGAFGLRTCVRVGRGTC